MKPNEQQRLVIEHFEGPCAVMAVPGSGKTASVTKRIARLIERGVDPKNILAVTFTNKAAKEMKERVGQLVGTEKSSLMTLSTFHSFCARLIRFNAQLLGLTSGYSIYDEDDSERLLKQCIRRVEGDLFKWNDTYLKALLGYLEGQRNACMTPLAGYAKYGISGNQARIIDEYFASLKRNNALDFNGLITGANTMFETDAALRDRIRTRFKFISVDEVQDTNTAQYELMKHLAMGHKNILIVGDLDQSIYKFRDACPENILKFEQDFGAKVLFLEKNYRSTPQILHHAQRLIERNLLRKATKLVTDNVPGDSPRIAAFQTDRDMADGIAGAAADLISRGVSPGEIAILYRTNYASRVLEEALRGRRMKYKLIGGLSFYDRKEVKTSLGILKLICNPNDRMAFAKSVEACCKGVGDRTVEKIVHESSASGKGVLVAAENIGHAPATLGTFVSAMKRAHPSDPGTALMDIAKETGFFDRMREESTTTNDRSLNIEELARDVGDYCEKPNATLAGYLQNISLLSSADDDGKDDAIKLMTMHACKGLEFDAVFVSHCNESIIPHSRALNEAGDEAELQSALEEERRLMYVAMTRARKHLRTCCFQLRRDPKTKRMEKFPPSRFLVETGLPGMPKAGGDPLSCVFG